MSSIVRGIDYCGSIVGIMYNGNRRYKSVVGGGLTILSGLGILAVAVYYLNIFFAQSLAKMSSEYIKYWEPPNLDISKDFTFGVMMQYQDANGFMPDVVKVDAFLVTKEERMTSRRKVESIPCSNNDYQNDSLYKALELDKAMCFNLTGVRLRGSNVNDFYQYLQIRFRLCIDDDTECYPQEKLATFFQKNKPVAIVYFLDSTFQIANKKERYKTFVNYVDVNITFNNAKSTNVYFSNNKMKVDDSYFFSTAPKVFERFMIDTSRDLVSVRTDHQAEALTINFMSSKNEQVINITYMQLSELLASIGALINVIILFLSSIGNYINHYYFQSDLMNALYTFDSYPKSKNNVFSFKKTNNVISLRECSKVSIVELGENKKENANEMMNNNNSHCVFKSEESKVNVPGDTNEKNEQKRAYSLKIKKKARSSLPRSITSTNDKAFDYWDISHIALSIIFPFIKCNPVIEKTRRFQQIEKSMASFQDFITVFKKLQEIDLLKYLFLTEEQLSMYEIMPKPEWNSVPNQPFSQLYHQKGFHFLKSLKEIDISLRKKNTRLNLLNFLSKPNKTPIDEKLVDLIKSRLNTSD